MEFLEQMSDYQILKKELDNTISPVALPYVTVERQVTAETAAIPVATFTGAEV
jgi:hypothetical protein